MKQERRVLKTLGRKVKQYRELRGWSQMLLAEEATVDKSYIGSIERAQVNPSIKKLAKIADALDVRIVDLLDE